jgi:hypothetical protein
MLKDVDPNLSIAVIGESVPNPTLSGIEGTLSKDCVRLRSRIGAKASAAAPALAMSAALAVWGGAISA